MGLRSEICVAIGGGGGTCGTEDRTWRRKSDSGDEFSASAISYIFTVSLLLERNPWYEQ